MAKKNTFPMDEIYNNIGSLFQDLTSYNNSIPEEFKSLQKDEYTVELPEPDFQIGNDKSLFNAVEKRRSNRDFSDIPMRQVMLSSLLWAVQGITIRKGEYFYRAAPSAGALYPVSTIVAVFNVEGLNKGIAVFDEKKNQLRYFKGGDSREFFSEAFMNQPMISDTSVLFLWAADLKKCLWRYRQRAYRYIYLDAGHMAQNCALACTSMGLGCATVGAFYDDQVNFLCDCDGVNKLVTYAAAVGYPSNGE